jgi:hypothetical protein
VVGCQARTQETPFRQLRSEIAPLTASLGIAVQSASKPLLNLQPLATVVRAPAPPQAVAKLAVPSTKPALVAPPPIAAVSEGSATAPESFAGTHVSQAEILRGLSRAELKTFRPVGTTSTVFRSALDAPFRAAFKLATQRKPYGAIAEVAAYRLARCLGLSNVPPAVLRKLDVRLLRRGLDAAFSDSWPTISERLLTQYGFVEGAAIYWIEGMRDLDIGAGEARERQLRGLLQEEALPDASQPLAAQLSSLLAFDYLIANWDRWSGGNVKGDASGQILYMRDNDVGFAADVSEVQQRRLLVRLLAVERFSRSFVTRLRALTPSAYERELAQDAGFAGGHRLSARSLAGLFDRRASLLSHVQALIEEHGEARVLAFP